MLKEKVNSRTNVDSEKNGGSYQLPEWNLTRENREGVTRANFRCLID